MVDRLVKYWMIVILIILFIGLAYPPLTIAALIVVIIERAILISVAINRPKKMELDLRKLKLNTRPTLPW